MFDLYFGDLEICVTPSVMYTMVDKGSSQFRGMHSKLQFKKYVLHKGMRVEVKPSGYRGDGPHCCESCMAKFKTAQGHFGHRSSKEHIAALRKSGSNSSMDSSSQSRSIFSSVASTGASMIHLLICDL